jgi:hypothetical protein
LRNISSPKIVIRFIYRAHIRYTSLIKKYQQGLFHHLSEQALIFNYQALYYND